MDFQKLEARFSRLSESVGPDGESQKRVLLGLCLDCLDYDDDAGDALIAKSFHQAKSLDKVMAKLPANMATASRDPAWIAFGRQLLLAGSSLEQTVAVMTSSFDKSRTPPLPNAPDAPIATPVPASPSAGPSGDVSPAP